MGDSSGPRQALIRWWRANCTLLCRVIHIKMATCLLGIHSKSRLITPHCVVHYVSLVVNTAHFVDSNSVDFPPNTVTKLKHNRLKVLKLEKWIHFFLKVYFQILKRIVLVFFIYISLYFC